ncbi:hypothetical protein FRC19_002513 [Serendipita sp. 401]|nr:hypothetical protein FRC19_002513 [Serendipita sp. 401]
MRGGKEFPQEKGQKRATKKQRNVGSCRRLIVPHEGVRVRGRKVPVCNMMTLSTLRRETVDKDIPISFDALREVSPTDTGDLAGPLVHSTAALVDTVEITNETEGEVGTDPVLTIEPVVGSVGKVVDVVVAARSIEASAGELRDPDLSAGEGVVEVGQVVDHVLERLAVPMNSHDVWLFIVSKDAHKGLQPRDTVVGAGGGRRDEGVSPVAAEREQHRPPQ